MKSTHKLNGEACNLYNQCIIMYVSLVEALSNPNSYLTGLSIPSVTSMSPAYDS